MRNNYDEFQKRGAEILAVGPNTETAFQKYWADEKIPYVGLPDPEHRVAVQYRQEVNLFKLGRMPLVCVIDREGRIRYAHYGGSMSDIPENQTLLHVIDQLNASSN
jgi:peroxiredoxin Q/BCP